MVNGRVEFGRHGKFDYSFEMRRTAVLATIASFGLVLSSCTFQEDATSMNSYESEALKWDTISGASSGTLLRMDFHSDFIDDRPLDVWLPDGYDGKRKHAILMMFDGQMLFDYKVTWNHQEWRVDEVVDSLIQKHAIIPPIVVGLHNGEQKRNFEYFPQKPFEKLKLSFSDSLRSSIAALKGSDSIYTVQSDAYLRYVVEEVLPLISENFTVYTGKQTTVIAGSSMGGLMSMYAMGEYPEVFGTALCMSTHWPGGFRPNDAIPHAFMDYLGRKINPGEHQKIYFDYGTETLDAMYEPFQVLADSVLMARGFQRDVNWRTVKYPGAAHNEVSWAKRLHVPICFALAKDQ